jgi:hypothetical protein
VIVPWPTYATITRFHTKQPALRRRAFLGAALEVLIIPGVVQVLRRHMAEKKIVVRLGRQRQPKALDLLARQILHRQLFIDQMQQVLFLADDRDVDEAIFRGPVVSSSR